MLNIRKHLNHVMQPFFVLLNKKLKTKRVRNAARVEHERMKGELRARVIYILSYHAVFDLNSLEV